MVRAADTNLEMIRHVARRLGDLRERMVFLGGAATALLITDTATPDVCVTTDVDVIVEIATKVEYYRLAELLRSLGFKEDHDEGAPVCRCAGGGLTELPWMSCRPTRKYSASVTSGTLRLCNLPR